MAECSIVEPMLPFKYSITVSGLSTLASRTIIGATLGRLRKVNHDAMKLWGEPMMPFKYNMASNLCQTKPSVQRAPTFRRGQPIHEFQRGSVEITIQGMVPVPDESA